MMTDSLFRDINGKVIREGDIIVCKKAWLIGNKHGMRHGMCGTRVYISWCSMKRRCDNEKAINYHRYGGRGITYDPGWETFEGFYEDMGDRPEGLSLGRIDNNLGYFKENCRWENSFQQMNNTTRNHFLEFDGKVQTLTQWARGLGMPWQVIRGRIQLGWSTKEALATPYIPYKK